MNDAQHRQSSLSAAAIARSRLRQMAPEELRALTESIVAALKTVYDPEIPADIYELGLIYNVDIDDSRFVTIEMTLTAPACPVAGRNADMGRERGRGRAGRRGRQGEHGVRSAVGSEPHVRRGARRARHVVTRTLSIRRRACRKTGVIRRPLQPPSPACRRRERCSWACAGSSGSPASARNLRVRPSGQVNEARINDPRVRGIAYQALLVAAVGLLVAGGAYQRLCQHAGPRHSDGLRLLEPDVAGFDINLHLIPYSGLSTYGQAFWVGLLNTLLVAAICIPLATRGGLRASASRACRRTGCMSRSALLYTIILRNTPLLLQLLFWYNAVLKSLPGPRQSISLGGLVFLNNRGLFLPGPVTLPGAMAFFAATALAADCRRSRFAVWARRRRNGRAQGRASGSLRRRSFSGCRRSPPCRRARRSRSMSRGCRGFNLKRWNSGHSRNGRACVRPRDLHLRLYRGDRSRRGPGRGARAVRGGRRSRTASRTGEQAGGHPAGDAAHRRRR